MNKLILTLILAVSLPVVAGAKGTTVETIVISVDASNFSCKMKKMAPHTGTLILEYPQGQLVLSQADQAVIDLKTELEHKTFTVLGSGDDCSGFESIFSDITAKKSATVELTIKKGGYTSTDSVAPYKVNFVEKNETVTISVGKAPGIELESYDFVREFPENN